MAIIEIIGALLMAGSGWLLAGAAFQADAGIQEQALAAIAAMPETAALAAAMLCGCIMLCAGAAGRRLLRKERAGKACAGKPADASAALKYGPLASEADAKKEL